MDMDMEPVRCVDNNKRKISHAQRKNADVLGSCMRRRPPDDSRQPEEVPLLFVGETAEPLGNHLVLLREQHLWLPVLVLDQGHQPFVIRLDKLRAHRWHRRVWWPPEA